jgi:hypothetical protein
MTPEQTAALKRAKDDAAKKALELYGEEVKRVCSEQGIPLIELAGDVHVHMALCVQEGSAVAVRAQWTFHDNPVVIAEMLEMAKAQGLI